MKLKEDFILHETNGQQVMVSTGASSFSGLVRTNKTAAFILECLKEETTEDGIVKAMLEKYDAPEELIRRDVARILDKLRSIGAISE